MSTYRVTENTYTPVYESQHPGSDTELPEMILDKKIDALQDQIGNLKEKLDKLDKNSAEYKKQEKRLEELEQKAEALEDKLESLGPDPSRSEIRAIKEDLKELREDVRDFSDDVDDVSDAQQLTDVREDTEATDDEIADLKTLLDGAKDKLSESEYNTLKGKLDKLDKWQGDLEELTKNLNSASNPKEIKDVSDKIERLRGHISDVKKDITEASSTLNDVREDIKASAKELEDARQLWNSVPTKLSSEERTALAERGGTLEKKQNELEKLVNALDNASSPKEIKDVSDKIERLRGHITDVKKDITEASSTPTNKADKDVPGLKKTFASIDKNITKLNRLLKSNEHKLKNKEYNALNGKVDALDKKHDELKKLVDDLSNYSSQKEIKSVSDKTKSISGDISDLKKEITKTGTPLNDVREDIKASAKELEDARQLWNSVPTKLSSEEKTALAERGGTLEKKQNELEKLVKALDNASSPKEIKDVSDKIKSLRGHISDVKNEITEASNPSKEDKLTPLKYNIDNLVRGKAVAFSMDGKRDEKGKFSTLPEDQNLVHNAVQELLNSDPEFANAFNAAVKGGLKGGLKIDFLYNAEDSRVELVNGKVLKVDIKAGDDIKAKLKEFFNAGTHYETSAPKGNRSAKEVVSDSRLSGEQMVKELEDLKVFDFAGPHADKVRKDIVEMFDKSPFERAALAHALEKHPDRTWTFSTTGHGGGAMSEPLDNHVNVAVSAENGYQSNLQAWSRMFHYASLDLKSSRDPRMIAADAIYKFEQGIDKSGEAVLSHLDINMFFDVIDSLEGKKPDEIPTAKEIVQRSLPFEHRSAEVREHAYEDALNGLVVEYHGAFTANDGEMLKDRTVPLSASIAEKYKTIIDYYLSHNPKKSKEDAAKWAFDQVKGRLPGVFPDGETLNGKDNTIVGQKDNGAYANNILDGWFKKHEGLKYITDAAS